MSQGGESMFPVISEDRRKRYIPSELQTRTTALEYQTQSVLSHHVPRSNLTPGRVRAQKDRSNTAHQNYQETDPSASEPWRTQLGSDLNFKPISELEEQDPKEFYWDYDGRRRVRNQVNMEKLAEVSPVKTSNLTENLKLAKVSSQVH